MTFSPVTREPLKREGEEGKPTMAVSLESALLRAAQSTHTRARAREQVFDGKLSESCEMCASIKITRGQLAAKKAIKNGPKT